MLLAAGVQSCIEDNLDHVSSEARVSAETLKVSLLKVAVKRIFQPLRPEQIKGSTSNIISAIRLGLQRYPVRV